MDLSTIIGILDQVMTGGPKGIIVMLVVIIVALLFDRKRIVAENVKKELKIDSIIDDYYKGNLTLAEALNSLRNVLYELKGKISD